MNFIDTVKGSMLERFYPAGWDFEKILQCVSNAPETVTDRQPYWNKDFTPVKCASLGDFDMMMGHEIANEIRKARDEGKKLVLILPVGPMGMYRWAVYFLKEWNVDCKHVYGFNMDEWSDSEGNTLEPSNPGAFENVEEYFPVPEELTDSSTLFMLKVSGESMIEAGIFDGDLVIVKQQSTALNGDKIVALINQEATVKTFYKEKDRIRLQPENKYMDPIYVDPSDSFAILGKVIGLFRRM